MKMIGELFSKGGHNLFLIIFLVIAGHTSLNAKPSVWDDSKLFIGLGPIFTSDAIGYAQIGTSFALSNEENVILSVGPLIGLGFAPNFFALDVDGFIKILYNFELSDKYSLGFYGKLPLGFSLMTLSSKVGTGFNLGIVPGLEFFFGPKIGVYTELGFTHHSYFFPKPKYIITAQTPPTHSPAGVFSAGVTIRL